jgi:hypothetical protein
MDPHAGMHQGFDTTFLLLYIGLVFFAAAVAGYWFSNKLHHRNTSQLKKAQKAELTKKRKLALRASHAMLGLAVVLIGSNLIQYTSGKYSIEKLNYQAEIQVVNDKDFGGGHSEAPIRYEMKIPTSGTHSPHDLKFGLYKERPPYENLVHNLEHGDIIIYFHPQANPDIVKRIEELTKYRKAGAGILGVPNSDLSQPDQIVMTAWTKTMELPAYDESKAGTFIYQYINQGPEKIPPEVRQGGGTM